MHESLTDDPRPQGLSQRVGRRLAALGLVGALMVALPLVQLLRYQNSEASTLAAAQAGLDPVARAVDVQRGLMAHRDAAALVLAGRDSFEPERQVRRGEVDERLTSLATTLVSGPWQRAVGESDALREDWLSLARNFAARSVAPTESEHAHRLLVEQTLQVIDLVADAGAPHAAASLQQLQPTLAVAHALPRLAWKLEQLAQPVADNNSRQRDLASAEAELARTLGMLNAALIVQPRPALADAGATAGAAADRYFQLLRNAGAETGAGQRSELQRAAGVALAAQFALFTQTHGDAAQQLSRQSRDVQIRSGRLIVAMLTLAAMALLLAVAARRSLRQLIDRAASAGLPQGADPHQPSVPQRHASALLDRLREGRSASDRTRRDSQPTLPGRF